MQLVSAIHGPTRTQRPAAVPHSTFEGAGIKFTGEHPRFKAFAATATAQVYGDKEGYATLKDAVDAVTMLTAGVREPAAGVFEQDGRFHGRKLDNAVTFATGVEWKGFWRLEQHPGDRDLLAPGFAGTTRSEALRAVVDGGYRIDVTHLPIA